MARTPLVRLGSILAHLALLPLVHIPFLILQLHRASVCDRELPLQRLSTGQIHVVSSPLLSLPRAGRSSLAGSGATS